MSRTPLGALIQSFFVDYLITIKGLRPASVRSYRDTIRLLLQFTATDKKTKITKLTLEDLDFQTVLKFLHYLEEERHNHIRTRNQRLAVLHTLYEYIATRQPQLLGVCQQVAAIPMKRVAPAPTHYLEHHEVQTLFKKLPSTEPLQLSDYTLLLFLYNTGARAQEVADLQVQHLELTEMPLAHLHGKGDKWRTCPLWHHTAKQLSQLLSQQPLEIADETPVFCARNGQALTRFGIYKIVRRTAGYLDDIRTGRTVTPHVFRHTAAMHLLEAGVEVNVIRGWLGHVDLTTTNRYAQINTQTKLEALRHTEPLLSSEAPRPRPVWSSDEKLLDWLSSL